MLAKVCAECEGLGLGFEVKAVEFEVLSLNRVNGIGLRSEFGEAFASSQLGSVEAAEAAWSLGGPPC